MQTLDVILPCYNPIPNWEENVITKFEQLQKSIPDIELQLIIVNDGSQNWDAKSEQTILNRIPKATILHHQVNLGKGRSIRTGAEYAKSNFMLFTDIDFPYEIDSVIAVLNSVVNESFDIAFAVRNTEYYEQVPYIRTVISKSLKMLVKTILQLPFTDTQGGLKAFNKVGKQQLLKTTTKGYLFDLELLKVAHGNGLAVSQVVSELRTDVEFTQMRPQVLLREFVNFVKIVFKH